MTDNNMLPVVEALEATTVPSDTKFIVDADGNVVEVTEEVTFVQDEGPVATELQQ